MRGLTTSLVLVLLSAASPASADIRNETPRPTMTNADLGKACGREAARVHRSMRRMPVTKDTLKVLRRDYRRDCVAKNKRLRSTAQAPGALDAPRHPVV